MPRLNFVPKRDGFHFRNNFENHVGPFTTYGRCGGMVYAALDYYLTGIPIPTHVGADFGTPNEVPPDGNRLADYIYNRLINSLTNVSAGRFVTWAAFWNSPATCVGWSLHDEFNHLRDRIDRGQLTPLGLVSLDGAIANGHQVLAYGYDFDANGLPLVYIYDNNFPDVECVLRASSALDEICEYDATTHPALDQTNGRWKGYFVHDDYDLSHPQRPPYQDIVMSQAVTLSGPTVQPDPAWSAGNPQSPSVCSTDQSPLAVHWAVRNCGDFNAHLHSLDSAVRGPHGENLDASLGGMDNNRTDLAPGEERVVDGHSDAFGVGPGIYSVSAARLSAQDDWFTVPILASAPATNTVIFELKPAAAHVDVSVSTGIPPVSSWPIQQRGGRTKVPSIPQVLPNPIPYPSGDPAPKPATKKG